MNNGLLEGLATGMGLGYLPGLPGTAGAAAGILVAWGVARLQFGWRLIVTAALVVLAVIVCEHGSRVHGGDSSHIVADEFLTMPVATSALPVLRNPALLVGVFVVSRVLDTLKPPPAGVAEKLHGGVGVVLDDVITNLWSLGLGVLGWRWWCRRGR